MPITNALIPTDLQDTLLAARRGAAGAAADLGLHASLPRVRSARDQENEYDVTQGLVGFRGDF